MTYVPKFPNAPHNYDAQNEAQFRAVVTRAISDTYGGVNDRLSSGTGFPTSILGWVHDLGFTASDNDTVAWGTGTITLTDGTAYNIASGNTGNMTTVNYIYLDIGVSATALQVSQTATNAVGPNRILVAVAQDAAAGKDALFQVFGGADNQKLSLVTADVIAADTITANEIATNTITATEIATGTITANEILANTITATEIAANTITGDEISSLNISTKTITADTGTVGGWTLSANSLSANFSSGVSGVSIDANTERILMGAATAPLTGTGVFLGLDTADYELRVGDPAGYYMHWNGSDLRLKGPIIDAPAVGSSPSILGWGHDMTFSVVDNNTVQWGSGTIYLADGATTYSIVAGNTGNMTASTTYYVYLDTDTSTTALQVASGSPSTAVGYNKILVAVCRPSAAGTDATFLVYGGSGGTGVSQTTNLNSQISGTLTTAFADAGLINSNVTINADGSLSGAGAGQASLTSLPGTIAAGQIAANAVIAGKINALAVTAGTIAAGVVTTTEIAANTITAGNIAANTITANEIASNTITATQIAAGTITTTELATGTLAAGNIEAGTIIASVVIATTSFTAANPVFDGSVAVEGGDGYKRVELTATGNYGAIQFYESASVNETGSIWGSASYGLRLAAVDGNIHFGGSSGFSSFASAVLYNNGDIWGPKECDGVLVGTGASTSYTTLKTESWTGDGSFIGAIVEFAGNVTGTNSTKGVRITAGGTSAVLFEPAAGDTGAWHVKVMIAPITTSSQRVYAVWTAPDGTTGIYRATRAINTVTTTFTLTLDGRTANASDEVECDLMISRSMANDGT